MFEQIDDNNNLKKLERNINICSAHGSKYIRCNLFFGSHLFFIEQD